MQRIETREVPVSYCDFCKEEAQHLTKCGCCKREMCSKDGMKAHAAFSVEIYRYVDGVRIQPMQQHICTGCAKVAPTGLSIEDLLNQMMGPDPVAWLEPVTDLVDDPPE